MHIPKLLKEELGGGNKEFSLADGELYNKEILSKVFYSFFNSSSGGHFVNIEDAEKFLTSADRQSILLHFLNSIRAEKEDVVGDVTFREGEAIGEILLEILFLYTVLAQRVGYFVFVLYSILEIEITLI